MTPLLFVDVETTGLRAEEGILLEVGLVVVDDDFNVVDAIDAVIGWKRIRGWLDDFIINMHGKSGLLEQVENAGMTLTDAEDVLIDFVKKHYEGKPVMAGSSPHFDRGWLRHHMPRLHDCFHYRNFDVTTLREFFGIRKPKDMPHRSIADLFVDIEQTRQFRDIVNGNSADDSAEEKEKTDDA